MVNKECMRREFKSKIIKDLSSLKPKQEEIDELLGIAGFFAVTIVGFLVFIGWIALCVFGCEATFGDGIVGVISVVTTSVGGLLGAGIIIWLCHSYLVVKEKCLAAEKRKAANTEG